MPTAYHADVGSLSRSARVYRRRRPPAVGDALRRDHQASRTVARDAWREPAYVAALAALVAYGVCHHALLAGCARPSDATGGLPQLPAILLERFPDPDGITRLPQCFRFLPPLTSPATVHA